MLERVFDLCEEIALFLEEKNVSAAEFQAPEFRYTECITKLAFLTDITAQFQDARFKSAY